MATSTNNALHIAIDFRWVSAILALTVVGMAVTVAVWQPWKANSERTIDMTGDATITATPDEFVFYPSYQVKNSSKDIALAEVTKKSTDILAKLKELGVADNKIKTNAGGYDFPFYFERTTNEATYTLQFTVTVDARELAQKVQDYLVSTTPSGAVSPQPTFSEAKRKELESQARNTATKDARAKAEQMGKNLGFRIGAVKQVSDSQSGGTTPYIAQPDIARDQAQSSQLKVQPGENNLQYQVRVTYFIY